MNYVELTYNICKNFGTYEVKKHNEKNTFSDSTVYVEISDYDYFGSSLSDMKNREDYIFYNVSIQNLPVELVEEVREEAEKCRKRGWTKKLESITGKRNNWKFTDEAIVESNEYIERVKHSIESEWGEEVIMSTLRYTTYSPVNKYYPKKTVPAHGEVDVVFGFRKHGLPKKGEAPSNCKNCPYFEYTGVETSHEWLEFYSYCKKMKKGLGDFGVKIENIERPSNCPLV